MTDHRPLQWVMNLKDTNSRLTRWRLKLSEYDYTVTYKQGKQNINADALSRIELHNEETSSLIVNTSERPPSVRRNSQQDDSDTITINSNSDTLTAHSSSETLTAHSDSNTMTVHTDSENPILEIPISDFPLNKFSRQIILTVVDDVKSRPTITKPFDNHTRTHIYLCKSNLEEDVVTAIKAYVNPKVKTGILINPTPAMYAIIPIIQDKFKSSSMDLVLTKVEIENVKDYLKQQEILRNYHEGKTNHRGINETHLALSRKYFWPKLKEHITKYINECTVCGQGKYDRNPVKQKFCIVPPPTKPFEIVHLDLLSVDTQKYLTIVDAFSKYAQAYHLRDATAISVVQALLSFSTHHGVPMTVVTDRGPEFTNQIFLEFTRLHKINHHKLLACAPNENGMVERLHSTLLEHLRLLKLERNGDSVTNLIPYAVLAYNSSIHSFTKCRPMDIITGHLDPRDPLDINLSENMLQQYSQEHRHKMQKVFDIINESSLNRRTQITENANKNREPEVQYHPDQQVFVRNPIASRRELAARYTHDTVLADLPIHIYTRRKRGPVAKSRLKRVPNSTLLLQGPTSDPGPSTSGRTNPN